jgi:predicted DNA-binding transcriptional regulator YafY
MAVNKQALLRYKTIDQCLQNRLRKWTLDDLIDAVADALYDFEGKETGIAKRTIQQDIQVMRSNTLGYNAPIIVVDKKYYTYEDKDYAIAKAQMNPADLNKLKDIVQLLKQFNGFGHFSEMTEMITKLENNIEQSTGAQYNYVQFETNPLLKGLNFINPLYQAIIHQMALNISYQSFKAKAPIEAIYYPYLLKEYRNRWFLICKHKKGNMLITLALDRIVSYTLNEKEKFVSYKGVDFNNYYSDLIGVTKTEKDRASTVVFHVHKAHAPYVITKPLHASQTILRHDEEGTLFSIKVVMNFELERELLGFGEFLKVLAPRLLVKKLSKRSAAMHELYEVKN